METVLGYSKEELKGNQDLLLELIHPEDRDRFRGHFTAPDEGTHAPMIFRMLDKEGEYRTLEHVCQIISDAEGKPIGRWGSNVDHTERTRMDSELEALSHTLLETQILFDALKKSLSMISIIDADGNRVDANQTLAATTGKSPEELKGRSPLDDVHPEDRAVAAKALNDAIESKEAHSATFRIMNKDGTYLWDHATAVPVTGAAGEYNGMIVIGSDITPIMEAQAALAESEQKFRTIVERIHDTLFIVQDGKIAFANPAMSRMSGYSPEELLKMDALAFIHPAELARVAGFAKQRAESGQAPENYETSVVSRNGEEINVLVSFSAIQYGGKPANLVTAIDITESARLLAAIKASEENYRTIFEEAPMSIFEVSMENAIIRANPAGARMLGYTQAELMGKTVCEITHEEDWDMTKNAMETILQKKDGVYKNEKRYVTKDAKTIWGQVNFTILEGADGRPTKRLVMIDDITSRKENEQKIEALMNKLIETNRTLEKINSELDAANERLVDSNKMKDLLYGKIAHDLRRPFIGLLGFGQFILDDAEEGKPVDLETAQINYQSAQNLFSLLERMMEYAKPRIEGLAPELKILDPREVIQAEIDIAGPQAHFKNITIHNRIMPNQAVYANKEELGAVIRNLINNAIKFSHEGGVVRIRSAHKDGWLQLSVEDHGVGMDPQTARSLFMGEEMNSTPGTAGESGTGFGTKIIRDNMQRMGGKVRVESEPGLGSKFIISLPMSAPEEKVG